MKRVALIFIAALVIPVFGDLISRADNNAVPSPESGLQVPGQAHPAAAETEPDNEKKEFYDLLILGIDRRPKQKTGRSDVIMIIHCEPGHVTLFSIPRDTLTYVRKRKDKINHAYSYGGIRLAKAAIERFLKFEVDNYITLDFQTFLTTIDTIKLLTDDGRLIGAENLLVSGDNLLKWLRFRSLPQGDRRRAQRHQLFMKRIFGYAQDMYINQNMLFSQCVKAGLKIAETDLTYEHVAELFEAYKDFDVENGIERYVLPGYSSPRYKANPALTADSYRQKHMPDLSAIDNDPNLTPEDKARKKEAALTRWKAENKPLSYYIPKYNWSLVTYIHFYRSKGISMNYVEKDVLRK